VHSTFHNYCVNIRKGGMLLSRYAWQIGSSEQFESGAGNTHKHVTDEHSELGYYQLQLARNIVLWRLSFRRAYGPVSADGHSQLQPGQ
jgi:hypothetical protein